MKLRIFTRRLATNYLSTLGFIGLSWWFFTSISPFHRNFLHAQWQLDTIGLSGVLEIHVLMRWLIALYAIALIPFYGRYPWLRSKAHVFLQGLWFMFARARRPESRARRARRAAEPLRLPWRLSLTPVAKQAALALLLKFFFAPLMINWCLSHAGDLTATVGNLFEGIKEGARGRFLFDTALFWACFQLILFVDTFLFTIGYIIEVPALRNRIRSVEPTFFGWFICLACYPPFNDFTNVFLQWQSADFPRFEGNVAHFSANIGILVLMSIYSWASVALGFKASNLTNRGIVARFPYSVVRHPAYIAKNLAWWVGALPTFYMMGAVSNWSGLAYSLFAMSGWTLIYVLRAITEERHLLLANNGYAEYMARVKWRFIPGLI